MSAQQLKIICEFGCLDAVRTLDAIHALWAKYRFPPDAFSLDEEPGLDLKRVSQRLRQAKSRGFLLRAQGLEFTLGAVRNHQLDFLLIKSAAAPVIPWEEWVEVFAADPRFVMAWVADSDYDYWQNAVDPLQYSAVGKPFSHLPMKSNGLPPPVEQKIIDISRNPGRWLFRDGYIEAVGSVMWLGEPFWRSTGASRNEILSAPWLASSPQRSVIRVQAAQACFNDASDPTGEHQERLRSLLFRHAKRSSALALNG